MNKFMKGLAMESRASQNRKNVESEITIYAEVGDMTGFKEASQVEGQIQFEAIVGEKGGRLRTRYVKEDKRSRYEITMKRPTASGGEDNVIISEMVENTIKIDEDFFNGFKVLASHAIVKNRYIFTSKNVELKVKLKGNTDPKHYTIPNVQYEVDVYLDKDGGISNTCKIDVEVDGIYNYLVTNHPELKDVKITLELKVSHLPFKPVNPTMILLDSDKDKFDEFWASVRMSPTEVSEDILDKLVIESEDDDSEDSDED